MKKPILTYSLTPFKNTISNTNDIHVHHHFNCTKDEILENISGLLERDDVEHITIFELPL